MESERTGGQGPWARQIERYGMTPMAVALVASSIAVFCALQAWQVIEHRDDWPLSSFPMYSERAGAYSARDRLVGVGRDGEFQLESRHTNPLGGARLRHVLGGRSRSKKGAKAFNTLLERYHARRDREGRGNPEVSAIRHYRETWKVNPRLKGIKHPRRKLVKTFLMVSDEHVRELRAEAKGKSKRAAPAPLPDGDVLLNAGDAELGAGVQRVADKYASHDEALLFSGSFPKQPDADSEAGARFQFEAPAGQYWVWLRGKAGKKGERADSVWVQVEQRTSRRGRVAKGGYGRFAEGYPANAFVWSSLQPGAKPYRVELEGDGPHQLRVLAREAGAVIDQVVLSRNWKEHPLLDTWLNDSGVKP